MNHYTDALTTPLDSRRMKIDVHEYLAPQLIVFLNCLLLSAQEKFDKTLHNNKAPHELQQQKECKAIKK